MRYRPSEFVFAMVVAFVPRLVMATSALATDAPCGSVTVPVKMPFVVCACTGITTNAKRSNDTKKLHTDAPRKHFAAFSKQELTKVMRHPRDGRGGLDFGAK